MTDVTIRAASSAEVESVLAFWQIAAEDSHRPVDTALAIRGLLVRDPEALLVALDGTDIIGSVIAGWDGWRCHLYRLAVHPDRRREGIARSLLGAAEERFRALGGRRVDAMVLIDNATGTDAWGALGYRRQREWARWIKPL